MGKLDQQELIIIRRRYQGLEESHSHGVWKIAYADFTTAMMAFFLVMWLINASDETTRQGMVQYFNPIKLVESAAQPKGLRDPLDDAAPSDGEEGIDSGKPAGVGGTELEGPSQGGGSEQTTPITENKNLSKPTDRGETKMTQEGDGRKLLVADQQSEARYTEEELFDNPYAILAALAVEAEALVHTDGSPGAGGPGALAQANTPILFAAPNRDPDGEGLADGMSFRDPFDPSGWQKEPLPGNAALLATIPALEVDDEGLKVEELTAAQIKLLENAADLARGGKTITGLAQADVTEGVKLKIASVEQEEIEQSDLGKGIATLFQSEKLMKDVAPAQEKPEKATVQSQVVPQVQAAELKQVEQAPAAKPVKQLEEKTADKTVEVASKSGEDKEVLSDNKLVDVKNAVGNALEGIASGASIEFAQHADGVLIQITDNEKFGMFSVGSAEPRPEIVLAMEKIAGVLKSREGDIVVRGHTDGRPFRSKNYDNWRLSTARAHMAYHMLVHGGLDEERIVAIEGYSDRRLKVAEDAYAPQNRRIEIILMNGVADAG
ncbi:MotB family protein [Rhodobacteraceae bacterium RKSG542]|uniref:MotB family protein n=1 Tax=Pseudovibrio flavus TaxID=2529854 RepID=UPI0012BD4CD2|nr:MotB family protein [Pseudovibrio flavus]MTI16772.1 MotB family protein [Pseudovibrio flavus]